MSKNGFRTDLEHLINRENMEQYSDTPDFILAAYLAACLEAFDAALQAREQWYSRPILRRDTAPTAQSPQAPSRDLPV